MHEGLSFLAELEIEDIGWILSHGRERAVGSGETVIQEGTEPDSLFLVLTGLVALEIASLGDREVARLGPGELLGEMSFLEEGPASASIRAVEDTEVLALDRSLLASKVREDPEFAARVYRSFALIAADRLRERVGALGGRVASPGAVSEPSSAWQALAPDIETCKATMQQIDRLAGGRGGVVPDEDAAAAIAGFNQLFEKLNALIGDDSGVDPQLAEEVGQRVQRELLAYVLLSRVAGRMYSKPRGYAGDFLTIDWMYEDEAGGVGVLGPLVDRAILDSPPAVAVKNRRGLLAEEIAKTRDSADPARVVSLACGPARELFDVYARMDDPASLQTTLIDIDHQALALVDERREALGLRRPMQLKHGNLVYLATGRETLELPEQHLIYSIGLIDYFEDKFVVLLMNWAHSLLAPGGRLILGNFHPRNVYKAMMDHLLDWKLIHRSEEDMDRLYEASAFGRPCTNIRFEEQGINLFAECTKE